MDLGSDPTDPMGNFHFVEGSIGIIDLSDRPLYTEVYVRIDFDFSS